MTYKSSTPAYQSIKISKVWVTPLYFPLSPPLSDSCLYANRRMNCPWNKNVCPCQEPLAPLATQSSTLCPTVGSVISEDVSKCGSCERHFGILQRIINNSYILQGLRFLNYQMGKTSKVLHFIWYKRYKLYFRAFIRAFLYQVYLYQWSLLKLLCTSLPGTE